MAKKNKSTYQLDLFCDSDSLYKITKPIRLIEFFAGVGFQRMGIQKGSKTSKCICTRADSCCVIERERE